MLIGGKVLHFLPFWHTICKDKYVLNLLKGIHVPFECGPPTQRHIPHELKMTDEEKAFVDQEVQHLLETNCIRSLPEMIPDGWVSNIFLVPKKNGGFRMILNLKQLNEHVVYTKFKMDHIDRVVQLLQEGDFLGSLDLVSAYSHLGIQEGYQKFFQFTWRGKFYCYTTLPQGFADAPRMFVRCTTPVMVHLRKMLIDIVIYIDDTFLRAPTVLELKRNLQITQDVFAQCGLTVNAEKSCLTPSTRMEFLGFILDSVKYTISVTPKKREVLAKLISPILAHPLRKIPIKLLAKIIGKIVAMFPANNEAKLNYRTLECFKMKAVNLHKNWHFALRLDSACLNELKWWKQYLQTDIVHKLHVWKVMQTIYSDASKSGFGAMWGSEEFQGHFTKKAGRVVNKYKRIACNLLHFEHICRKVMRRSGPLEM